MFQLNCEISSPGEEPGMTRHARERSAWRASLGGSAYHGRMVGFSPDGSLSRRRSTNEGEDR